MCAMRCKCFAGLCLFGASARPRTDELVLGPCSRGCRARQNPPCWFLQRLCICGPSLGLPFAPSSGLVWPVFYCLFGGWVGVLRPSVWWCPLGVFWVPLRPLWRCFSLGVVCFGWCFGGVLQGLLCKEAWYWPSKASAMKPLVYYMGAQRPPLPGRKASCV